MREPRLGREAPSRYKEREGGGRRRVSEGEQYRYERWLRTERFAWKGGGRIKVNKE